MIELLVVIGIIALLVALLLPALNRVREQSKQVGCASNLRQMGQALVLYTTETGYYPGCYVTNRSPAFAVWPTRLRRYMRGINDMFHCPSQEGSNRWVSTFGVGAQFAVATDAGYGYKAGESLLDPTKIPFSYGYNDWGCDKKQPESAALQRGLGGDLPGRELLAMRVQLPGDMIAIGDNLGSGSWDYNLDPLQSDQYPGKIHNGGANMLFCDGHVTWYAQTDLIIPGPFNPASQHDVTVAAMWNNNHAGTN